MSLASDFHMYYNETFVGVHNQAGEVLPFYVVNVSFADGTEFNGDDHDPELMDSLVFHGHDIVGNSDDGYRYSDRPRSLPITECILDIPKLGYFEVPGEGKLWLSYNPQRSTKKGFTFRRTNYRGDGGNNRRLRLVKQVYADNRSDFERNFLFIKDRAVQRIMYKGVNVGRINSDGELRIHPEVDVYLHSIIEKGLEERNANSTNPTSI